MKEITGKKCGGCLIIRCANKKIGVVARLRKYESTLQPISRRQSRPYICFSIWSTKINGVVKPPNLP
jgi:hypothetical protein